MTQLSKLKSTIRARALRLYAHLEDCSRLVAYRQWQSSERGGSMLEALRAEVFDLGRNEQDFDATISSLIRIKQIHEQKLPSVPGIEIPIELACFMREFESPGRKYEVHGSEQLSDSVAEFHNPDSPASHAALNSFRELLSGESIQRAVSTTHDLRLPRMDMGAPVRWPTLIHEMGHAEGAALVNQFESLVGPIGWKAAIAELRSEYFSGRDLELDYELENILRSWVLEICCDVEAYDRVGPAIFFSQLYAFGADISYFGAAESHLESHPPPVFRLQILRHLAAGSYAGVEDALRNELIQKMDEGIGHLQWLSESIRGSRHPETNRLRKMLDFWASRTRARKPNPIRLQDVRFLQKSVRRRHPCPTLKNGAPAPIGAILLAAAMDNADPESTLARDEAIRRSIQLREWVKEFGTHPLRRSVRRTHLCNTSSVLVDADLIAMLKRKVDPLRVVPILDSNVQVGSASIDLRLGHYFEIFDEGAMQLVDFVSESNIARRSREVSFDLGQGITISPGRFILGHTLEFIKLPKDVCGQIEGRSSFGRLGIQVHMTANLIDCGFTGVITLEILNMGPDPVKLYPGLRIAQLRLFHTSIPDKPYSPSAKYSGRFRHHVSTQGRDSEIKKLNRLVLRRKSQ